MDISKGDLVKSSGEWAIITGCATARIFKCHCLTKATSIILSEHEIDQVVYEEPTGQFLNVLSQQEKIEYARYYKYKAQEDLKGDKNSVGAEDVAGKRLNNIVEVHGVFSPTTPFKYHVEDGAIHSVKVDMTFTDESGKYLENTLKRWDTSGGRSKNQELFDPFDDQTPYPLDFDNFVYGDVEQCYDEERDYLVIKCVDDFIEHMMTR